MTRPLRELRGNQLAEALQSAGVVPPTVVDVTAQPPIPTEIMRDMLTPKQAADQDALLKDVRAWLERLVTGERVPIRHMTVVVPQHRRQQIASRLKSRGLIAIVFGSHGGADATSKLIELARDNVTDDQLYEIALTDNPDEPTQIEDDEPAEDEEQEPVPAYDPPRVKLAGSKTGRDAQRVAALRDWLGHGVRGGRMQLTQIGPNTGSPSGDNHSIGLRLREWGYIERRGTHGHAWFVVPESIRETVRRLTDTQLAEVIWPGRSAPLPDMNDLESDTPEEPTTNNAAEAAPEPPVEDPGEPPSLAQLTRDVALLATRMGQFLLILERLDARYARIERELGITKPIEEELGQG